MFGIDDALLAAGASAAIGGISNWFGTSDTNDANRDIARDTNRQNLAISRENNTFSAAQATRMMDFQADQALRSRNYNTDMSNTSWQRGVADMKAAGINPMLAFSKGGASTPMSPTPSGAMGSASSIPMQTGAPMQNRMSGVTPALATALGVYQAKTQLDNAKLTGQSIASDIALKAAQTGVAANSAKKILADTTLTQANTPKAQAYGKAYQIALDTANSAKDIVSSHSNFLKSATTEKGMYPSKDSSFMRWSRGELPWQAKSLLRKHF